jgi:hypothetical protein
VAAAKSDFVRHRRKCIPERERSTILFVGLRCAGGRRDQAIVLGKGANMNFISRLKAEHGFFQEIHPLEHPPPIMQYRRRQVEHYLSRYADVFRETQGR